MREQVPKLGRSFTRVSGIRGKDLTKTQIQDETTFLCGKFCTHSMIGCTMSHKKVWKKIVENNDKYAIVMEDDCVLTDSFQQDLRLVLNELIPKNPDFIYLGCFGACNDDKKYDWITLLQKYSIFYSIKNRSNFSGIYSYVPETPFGFHCYIISKECAKYLLRQIEKVEYQVDVTFLKHTRDLKVFASKKKLGTQFASAEQSTQSSYVFPSSLNSILGKHRDKNNISYSFHLNSAIFELLGFPVNLYLLFACIIAFVIPNKQYMINIFTAFLIYEFILNPKNIDIIFFWYIFIYIIYRYK
jgi:GR25 family glycosyltransferase involved in LPS biosynthesis